MLKQFSAAKKLLSQNRSPKGGFRKFKGLNIKYSHSDPQKALLHPERCYLTYFA